MSQVRLRVAISLLLLSIPAGAQRSGILFTAGPDTGEKSEDGSPALPSIAPVAILSNGELAGCPASKDGYTKEFTGRLTRLYSSGRQFPLYYRGGVFGKLQAKKSCMDPDLSDLSGCVKFLAADEPGVRQKDFAGSVWSGTPPSITHPILRQRATAEERESFLQQAVLMFAAKGVKVKPDKLRSDAIWKIQTSQEMKLLVGNVRYRFPANKPRSYMSDRLLLAVTADNPNSSPMLVHWHQTQVWLDASDPIPKESEEIDEGSNGDLEEFLDNFPLFPTEPDVLVTKHAYYEDWAYSVYRWDGKMYKLAFTSCGGGD